jgi:AcrR family transcriptional regulator
MDSNTYHHGDLKNALVKAGVEILAKEGLSGLSLRKVAKQAGVSHAAPYAHFKDKQALVAAISTEGHARIYAEISTVIKDNPDAPLQQLVLAALAYLRFSQDEPDLFRITFSGAVEQERDYPALVEIAHQNFELIEYIVSRGRVAGIFSTAPDELLAQSLWGAVHGLIALTQQGQISSAVLDRYSSRDLILFALDQMTRVSINPGDFSDNP